MEFTIYTFKACPSSTAIPSPTGSCLYLLSNNTTTWSPISQMPKIMNIISNVLESPLKPRIRFPVWGNVHIWPLAFPQCSLSGLHGCIFSGISHSYSQNWKWRFYDSFFDASLMTLKSAQCEWHYQGWLPSWNGPCYSRIICCTFDWICFPEGENIINIIILTKLDFLRMRSCLSGTMLSIPMQIRALFILLISLCTTLNFPVPLFTANYTFFISL